MTEWRGRYDRKVAELASLGMPACSSVYGPDPSVQCQISGPHEHHEARVGGTHFLWSDRAHSTTWTR